MTMNGYNFILQSYDLLEIPMGPAILLVGIMALLLMATIRFRNPLGVIAWGMTVLFFVLTALFDLGFEITWLMVSITAVLTVIGVVARWAV